jgi:hypothetical protein
MGGHLPNHSNNTASLSVPLEGNISAQSGAFTAPSSRVLGNPGIVELARWRKRRASSPCPLKLPALRNLPGRRNRKVVAAHAALPAGAKGGGSSQKYLGRYLLGGVYWWATVFSCTHPPMRTGAPLKPISERPALAAPAAATARKIPTSKRVLSAALLSCIRHRIAASASVQD